MLDNPCGEEIVPPIYSKPSLEQSEAHIQANLLSLFTPSFGLCHRTGRTSGASSIFSSKRPQPMAHPQVLSAAPQPSQQGGQENSELAEVLNGAQNPAPGTAS